MKFKNVILFFCIAIIVEQQTYAFTISQYAPDCIFEKPYFDQEHFAMVSAIFSGGYADKAFNNASETVPFLQQFGYEDFLTKFINPTLPDNDISSLGKGLLTGEFHIREVALSFYKNTMHGMFIEGAIAMQDLTVNSITAEFIPSSQPLTPEQSAYLEVLQHNLPTSMNRSGMFTTGLYLGYSASFNNFTHLDFIDFSVKAGVLTPEYMQDSNDSLLRFPFNGNFNFGYPIVAATSIGLCDWLTIGLNGLLMGSQPATINSRINTTNSHNQLLIKDETLVKIYRKLRLSAGAYIEADHLFYGCSATAGYLYTKNEPYKIVPILQTDVLRNFDPQSVLYDGWSYGYLYFQFDIDFAHEKKPCAPIIKFFCAIPVAGQYAPKTNLFGGSCNFQISYAY